MSWQEIIDELAERAWTLSFEPAHFFGGTSGINVSVLPFEPEEDDEEETRDVPPPGVGRIVHFDDRGVIDESKLRGVVSDLFQTMRESTDG